MKKTKLQSYLDFIAQLHKVKHEKKSEKKSLKNPSEKKMKFIALFFFSMSSLVLGSTFTTDYYIDSPVKKDHPLKSFFETTTNLNSTSLLKIELVSFTATLIEKTVDVEWKIQKETQNTFFTIERSGDDDLYYPIGTVQSIGYSDHERIYTFEDSYPLEGVSYYRLAQTDINGQVKRYPSTVIDNKNSKSVFLYPNPAPTGKVHISGVNEKLNYSITVRDLTGKIVPSIITWGENNDLDLVIDETITSRKGIFIVTINDGKHITQQKLIVK